MKRTKPDRWISPVQARCACCNRLLFRSQLKKKRGFFFCEHCYSKRKVAVFLKKKKFAMAKQRNSEKRWLQKKLLCCLKRAMANG